jgi:hypothetical protein
VQFVLSASIQHCSIQDAPDPGLKGSSNECITGIAAAYVMLASCAQNGKQPHLATLP